MAKRKKITPALLPGRINLFDALLLLVELELKPGWLRPEIRQYLPCYRVKEGKTHKFAVAEIDDEGEALSWVYTLVKVAVEHQEDLRAAITKLTRKMKWLRLEIQAGRIRGQLEPSDSQVIPLDTSNGHMLRTQRSGAFCTSRLLVRYGEQRIPALISFRNSSLQASIRAPRDPSDAINQHSRDLLELEKSNLNAAIALVEKLVKSYSAGSLPEFSRRELVGMLARKAKIVLRDNKQPNPAGKMLVASTRLEKYIFPNPSIKALSSKRGRSSTENDRRKREFIGHFESNGS